MVWLRINHSVLGPWAILEHFEEVPQFDCPHSEARFPRAENTQNSGQNCRKLILPAGANSGSAFVQNGSRSNL